MVLNWISYPSKPIEIENPHNLVHAHVTIKGVQAGFVLGAAAATIRNFYSMKRSKTEKIFNWDRFGRYTRNGVLPLIVMVNYNCYTALTSSVIQKNQSRAFRIYNNKGQNLSDDLTLGGIVGGLLIAGIKKQKSFGQICVSASLGGLIGLFIDFGIVGAKAITGSQH